MKAGLIGAGIGASLTPPMHEAEGRAQGLAYTYTRFDTACAPWSGMPLDAILDHAEAEGFSGVNITHPFKIEAARLADELRGAARDLGAINTMVFDGGRRVGHNTDCAGFRAALARDLADAPMGEVLLLGAGGAGAAVAFALIDHGVRRLVIHDRAGAAAEALARQLAGARPGAAVHAAATRDAIDRATLDGLVNATPMGMQAYPGMALDPEGLPPGAWVADIVYFPLETALLARARALGLGTMSGAAMAVFQAVGSFELFTGRAADPARLTAVFDRLQSREARATGDSDNKTTTTATGADRS